MKAGTHVLILESLQLKGLYVEDLLYFPQCVFCLLLLLTGYFIEKKLHFGVVWFIDISFSFYGSCLRCDVRKLT